MQMVTAAVDLAIIMTMTTKSVFVYQEHRDAADVTMDSHLWMVHANVTTHTITQLTMAVNAGQE